MKNNNLFKKSQQNRKQHNDDIIERMYSGESLTRFKPSSSWFPPRPIITKDKGALDRLYGQIYPSLNKDKSLTSRKTIEFKNNH